jgi:glycerophosphoryl diester phosphodiesterase
MSLPIITSHAACKGHAPENTLAGVRAALALAADASLVTLSEAKGLAPRERRGGCFDKLSRT